MLCRDGSRDALTGQIRAFLTERLRLSVNVPLHPACDA
jgi:hypothetical protein